MPTSTGTNLPQPGGAGIIPQRSSGTTYVGWAQILGESQFPRPTTVTPQAPAPQTASPATQPTVAGIEPQAYEAILYGKDIPLFIGGKALIGGRIIEGPYFGGTQADPTVSFVAYHALNIVSHAFQYDLTQVTQARLRGQEVWNSTSGYIATDKLPSGAFQWLPGHNAQPPPAQSIVRHGASAIAYAGGIVSSWEDLPLKPFGGIVPFPSVLVECSRFGDPDDGIPRSDAIEAILGYMGLAAAEYEIDVTGSDPAWLISNNMTLTEFLQQLRSIYVNWRITYTDKLRIIEPTEFDVSFALTNDNVLRDTLKFRRTDPLLTSIEKQYTFIDIDRDYEMNMVSAKEEHYPHPTTDATRSTKIELPVVTTSAQALADIHQSLYEELSVRNMMDGAGNVTLFGMEVGDGVRFADSDVIDFFSRVMETTHDFENWIVNFQSGEVLNCGFAFPDPHFGEVILLLHCNGDPASTTFVDFSSFAHTMTANGNAQVSSTSKFGSGSLLCDGSTDGVTSNSNTTLQDEALSPTNTSPYTIECWARFDAINRVQILVAVDQGLFARFFRLKQNGDDELMFEWSNTNGSTFDDSVSTSSANLVIDTWYFIAVDKDSTGKIRIYVDGVLRGSATPAASVIALTTAAMSVGSSGLLSGSSFQGRIDDVRITRGVSRYGDVTGDATFAVPSTQFADSD